MTDILDKLFASKAAAMALDREKESLEYLRQIATRRIDERRPFRARLEAARGSAIIAEIKRASPSKGLIVREIDPAALAAAYERAGADAISVLTEADHFLGDLAYLDLARKASALPLLRKDFLTDEYGVVQSAAYGADAILAILAGIDDSTLAMMLDAARAWRMDVLVEIHDEAELRRALAAGVTLLGINNRDLRTFETHLGIAEELLPHIPRTVTVISESGIRAASDTQDLIQAGARGFLIGETLMRAENPADLIGQIKAKSVAPH